MKLNLQYHCNKCKTDQDHTVRDGGSYFCPGCNGMMMQRCNEYVEDVVTRKITLSGKKSWRPAAILVMLRKAVKEKRFKVQ